MTSDLKTLDWALAFLDISALEENLDEPGLVVS